MLFKDRHRCSQIEAFDDWGDTFCGWCCCLRGSFRRESLASVVTLSRRSLSMQREHQNCSTETRIYFSSSLRRLVTFFFFISHSVHVPAWPFCCLINIYRGNKTSVWTIRIIWVSGDTGAISASTLQEINPLHQLCAHWKSNSVFVCLFYLFF